MKSSIAGAIERDNNFRQGVIELSGHRVYLGCIEMCIFFAKVAEPSGVVIGVGECSGREDT
jgi:hypothetical protein